MAIKHGQKLFMTPTTTVSVSNPIAVYTDDELTIGIGGTSTSFTLKFEGSLDGETYFEILGTKVKDESISATSTSTVGEAWSFDISTWAYVRVNLTAIGNGNVTAYANAG